MFNNVTLAKNLARQPRLLQRALAPLLPIARFDARKLIVAPSFARQVQQAERHLPREIPAEAKTLLARGLEVLEQLQPARLGSIAAWTKDPDRLTELVVQQARGESKQLSLEQYNAAVRAGQIGRLLQREAAALAASKTELAIVPATTDPLAAELRLLSARLKAHGLPDLTAKAAVAGNRRQLDQVVTAFREQKFLAAGPGWTVERQRFARLVSMSQDLLEREPPRDQDKHR
jgi:hypothetical protein